MLPARRSAPEHDHVWPRSTAPQPDGIGRESILSRETGVPGEKPSKSDWDRLKRIPHTTQGQSWTRVTEVGGHGWWPLNHPDSPWPITTLRKLLTNVKDTKTNLQRQGAVYKIKGCDCQATYIGETGRNLSTRLTEHRRGTVTSTVAEHHLQTNHRIDWDSASCVTYSTNYYKRIVLESWFTNLAQSPINRCLQLPAPYKRLIDDINRQTTHFSIYSITVVHNVFYNTRTDLRPIDGSKRTKHRLVFQANYI